MCSSPAVPNKVDAKCMYQKKETKEVYGMFHALYSGKNYKSSEDTSLLTHYNKWLITKQEYLKKKQSKKI